MVDKGKGFQIFAHILLSFLIICAIAPFILLIMSSITEEQTLITNGYSFFPEKFSTYAYEYLFTKSAAVFRGYAISFLVTAIGTVCNLLFTTLYAYPLSRKELPGRNIFAFYLFFTMLFSGGLVPSYLMWTQTFHIRNTVFALLIPNLLMSAFNVIMMRTYFTANIPDAVIEAARVDGASEFKILFGIVLPMALPIIATIGLLVGLAYWNDWMNGLYYLNAFHLGPHGSDRNGHSAGYGYISFHAKIFCKRYCHRRCKGLSKRLNSPVPSQLRKNYKRESPCGTECPGLSLFLPFRKSYRTDMGRNACSLKLPPVCFFPGIIPAIKLEAPVKMISIHTDYGQNQQPERKAHEIRRHGLCGHSRCPGPPGQRFKY